MRDGAERAHDLVDRRLDMVTAHRHPVDVLQHVGLRRVRPDVVHDAVEYLGVRALEARPVLVQQGEVLAREAGHVDVEVAGNQARLSGQDAVPERTAGKEVAEEGCGHAVPPDELARGRVHVAREHVLDTNARAQLRGHLLTDGVQRERRCLRAGAVGAEPNAPQPRQAKHAVGALPQVGLELRAQALAHLRGPESLGEARGPVRGDSRVC
mmetsp:Transcript_45587/g.117871  ORF Transcript_45587/g.117871 Transcript_45587/m.117871 type:complete len:211 (-) Transcript_45587:865-1497(-)